MYDEIIEIAENRAYLQAVKDGYGHGPNLDLLNTLPPYEEESIKELERDLEDSSKLTFHWVFREPVGYYHMKLFLISDYSVDKAIFLNDVRLYKTLNDPKARLAVAKLLVERFLSPNYHKRFPIGSSVFDRGSRPEGLESNEPAQRDESKVNELSSSVGVPHEMLQLNAKGTNPIGVFGKPITKVEECIQNEIAPVELFEKIERLVRNDLKLDVFPRFMKSEFYKRYIQCKWLEKRKTTIQDFDILRVLGRGAFGFVKACIKKDSGKLYAMKCIDKKRVMATDSVDTIMYEREFLSMMDSNFVVCLKYAVMDDDNLFLVLDLMVGGDLKFHLNKDERFGEERSRFYAAEVLLGLEHMHSKGVIYRDMKLENVLLDERGHCRISDLGLAVRSKDKVKGYAGTPGYTAPEVIKGHPYNHMADFFSYGVMVYRFLSGKKPFATRPDRNRDRNAAKQRRRRNKRRSGKSDLDNNVVKMEPEFPERYFSPDAKDFLRKLMRKDPEKRLGIDGIDDIKTHPWFNPIDFGLLEAGYLDPPFCPNQDEVNADSLRHIGRPQQDDKYKKVRLTPDFQKTLVKFPFQSMTALQEETVEVLQKADDGKNFERFAQRRPVTAADPASQNPNQSSCCSFL